jgi:hypothetical protein
MLNVYKNQQNWQTGSRNLMGPKTGGGGYAKCENVRQFASSKI